MQVYDSIETTQGVTEQDFSENFRPKMEEMGARMQELETALAKASITSREAQR